jgi:hypothetical protein
MSDQIEWAEPPTDGHDRYDREYWAERVREMMSFRTADWRMPVYPDPATVAPAQGNFKYCYICGDDLRELRTECVHRDIRRSDEINSFGSPDYGEDRSYVLSTCTECFEQYLQST